MREALRALLEQVPHDVAAGVRNALSPLREVDVSVLPAEVREDFCWVISHPFQSPADAAEIAERIAFLAHALNCVNDDEEGSMESPG